MIHILQDLCRLDGARLAKVVMEGASLEEVTSPNAKEFAIQAAQRFGLTMAGIAGTSGPYIVGEDGKPPSGQIPAGTPLKWRIEYDVGGAL